MSRCRNYYRRLRKRPFTADLDDFRKEIDTVVKVTKRMLKATGSQFAKNQKLAIRTLEFLFSGL